MQQVLARLASDCDIYWARGLLVCITGGLEFSITEFDKVATLVSAERPDMANLVISVIIDPSMPPDALWVTIIAAGVAD